MQLFILDNTLNITPANHLVSKNNHQVFQNKYILYRSGAIINRMFHSMLFTTADNILILAAWVDVQYRDEKLLVTPL